MADSNSTSAQSRGQVLHCTVNNATMRREDYKNCTECWET